jgi:hypothetical protein
MTRWTPPPVAAAALDALEALEAPSFPLPLPESVRVGEARWSTQASDAGAILAAYSKSDAPLPSGSNLRTERLMLIVEAPFRTSAVIPSPTIPGSYAIATRPTLSVIGAGEVPSFTTMARVGSCRSPEEEQSSVMAEATVDEKPWLLWVGYIYDEENDERTDPSQPPPTTSKPVGIIVQMSFAEAQAMGDSIRKELRPWPAQLQGPDRFGAFSARIDTDEGPVVVNGLALENFLEFAAAVHQVD